MSQVVHDKYAQMVKVDDVDLIPAAIVAAQTRDGKDELIVGAGAMVLDSGSGMWLPVSAANRLPVEATITGSVVDSVDNAVRTKMVGLSWVSFDPFGETIEVPAGAFVTAQPAQLVNGFGVLGILCRNVITGGSGRTPFRLDVIWQSTPGNLVSARSINERFTYDPEGTMISGLALSLPTKSQYVLFRIFNDDDQDQTFHCHGMLRAS